MDYLNLKKPRIHISYSDRHYNPAAVNQEKFWFSCSQIAMYLWQAVSSSEVDASFGDAVPDGPIDLLWTNRLDPAPVRVGRVVYFASVAHYAFVRTRVAAVLARATSTPVEGLYRVGERWRLWRALETAHRVAIIGNEAVLRSYAGYAPDFPGKYTLLDCGVDTAHFCPTGNPEAAAFVHCVTRFSLRKGTHVVADAWPSFVAEHPGAKLILLGRNGDFDVAASLKGCPGVEFVGAFESGSAAYLRQLSRARWVALPSLAEGQAGTLLEAMSVGCVPVATRETGIHPDEYGGWVVDRPDAEALRRAMQEAFARSPADAGRAVRERVEKKHAWSLFQRRMMAIQRAALAGPPLRRRSAGLSALAFLFSELRRRTGGHPRVRADKI